MAAHTVTGLQTDSPQELRGIAFRRQLERHYDTALDFYQKAIEKSTKEYGANSTYTGDLYFEMGMLAFSMSKFTTAEYCLTKAVQINPHAVVARLKLAEILRLREKPTAAQAQVQQSVEHNVNSPEARLQLVAWLQETNPAAAAKHSFVLHQILLGIPIKQPPVKRTVAPKEENSGNAKKPVAVSADKPSSAKSGGKPSAKPAKAQEQQKEQAAKAKDVANAAHNKAKPDKKQESKVAKARQAAPAQAKAAAKPSVPNDGLQEQTAQIAPVGAQSEAKPTTEKSQPSSKESAPEHKVTKTASASPKASKRSAHGGALVPPPPAMAIPMMMPPPGFGSAPVATQTAKPAKSKTKPPSESKAESAQPAPQQKRSAGGRESAANASEDPDFLIEWASVKKQKKGASKPAAPAEAAPAEKNSN
jgi:tetratricopeptide (TPR) repeat protein